MSQPLDSQQSYHSSLQHGFDNMGLGDNTAAQSIAPYEYGTGQVNPYAQGQDMFYQPTQSTYTMPLNFLNYAPLAPYPQKLLPFQKNIHSFFLSDNIREELQRKGEAALQTMPNIPGSLLPTSINEYHSLVPLDMSNQKSAQTFGYPSWVYKAFSTEDANTYTLRRVEGFRLSNENDIRIVQRWKKVTSANIVTIHNAWTTTKFGDSSIVFVYDYHPLSKTLAEAHFGPTPIFAGSRHVPENVVWSYIVQLASALKTIHNTGLAARVIDLSKVLLTSKMRIRLNCCGILDVIASEPSRSLQEHQSDDFIKLGRMMLAIACNSPVAAQNYPKSMEYIGKQYSTNLRDQIFLLASGQIKTIDELAKNISSHTLQNFNASLHCEDALESELSRELENGRIVRLLCKFGFINERPEFDHDPRWSETGDRYYIKLFRDYVFHSVDENGNPVVDLAHVLTCLNKLDAGVDEKIMLVSRDSLNCFVLSYKDLKRNIESTFMELSKSGGRR
ncbi:hypothetical protein K440DRAFT_618045 [Wilcoxina mikolae CBS 423.85]|nr:hypothetical protein K440DRAFT_618045 [Wilcoxina mikolae CBS 423.85]